MVSKTVPKKKVVTPRKRNRQAKQNETLQKMAQNSQLLSRSMLGSRLGVQFDGERDLYGTFGYIRGPDFQVYQNMYDRQGLGHRVIKKYANSTWNRMPILIDGEQRSDTLDDGATGFLKEWVKLSKRLRLAQVFREADIMCQIGQYSIIFLGTSGDDYSLPASKSGGLFYAAAYNESQSIIGSLIDDVKSEKFGMPERYTVAFNEKDIGVATPGGTNIHHTRALHISEDRLGSRIYGTPRLKAPLNRLFDLEKVTGGGAEAAWLAVWGGMLFSTQEGIDIPSEDSEEGKYMADQMQKYFHRMQRYAVLKGLDVNNLGTQTVNIEQIYNTLKTDFAGTVGIPQRILFGSERGELASSQDKEEWNAETDTRRTNFAEPDVLDPFIEWCIEIGVLPPPENKEWSYEWYPVYPMTKVEKANYANALATGANTITGGAPETALDVNEWRSTADLPTRDVEEIEDIKEETLQEDIRKEQEMQKLFKPKTKEEEPVTRKEFKNEMDKVMQHNQDLIAPIVTLLKERQVAEVRQNFENRSVVQRISDFVQRRPEPSQVNVNVENYPGKRPKVKVISQVQPTPIQNNIDVQPGSTTVNVPPTEVNVINRILNRLRPGPITVQSPAVEVKNYNEVKLPKVTEVSVVKRDEEGRADKIEKTYKQDEDPE